MRRTTGLTAALVMVLSLSGNAFARILFEDDQYFNVQSEGIILDQNNNLDAGTLSTNTYTMADAACLNGETYTATINSTAVVYTATTANCAGNDAADTVAVLQGLTAAIDADFTVGYLVDAAYSLNTVTVTATVADPANNYTTTAGDTSTAGTLVATGATLAGGVIGDTVDLQFGNDTTDALFTYDPNNQNLTLSTPGGTFDFSDDDLKTTGGIIMQGSNEFHIREDSDPASNATCTTLDEVIIDTTDNELQICTATGSPGTWVGISAGSLGGLTSSQFLRSDTSDSYTSGTLTFDAGTILDVNGGIDFSGATSFLLYQGAANPGTCTEGEMFYNTNTNVTSICTSTNTWTGLSSAGTPNFEAVYAADGDDTLTASGAFNINATGGAVGIDSSAGISIGATGAASDFTVASDGAADDLTLEVTGATDSSVVLSSSGTGTDAIDINATAGDIDIDATGDNGITIDATESSNLTVATDAAAEDLTIAVTGATDSSVVVNSSGTGTDAVDINATAGGVTIDAAGALSFQGAANSDITTTGTSDISINAGDDLFFDDAQLSGIVQLSVTDSDWAATFATDGIIDNINSFTLNTAGNGASNVGIQDASSWFTGTEIETALNEIEALFGSTTSSTFNFTEDNVLADDDSVYTALNKLDLKWGDLGNTANGEGASLVGIEDSGGYTTETTVEGALQELYGDIGKNFEDLTFYPEYPDAVVHADGSNNRGLLEGLYDTGEESGYYNWTSRRATTQDIDIRFAFPLPTDFNATGDFTFRYRTGSVTEADNDVEVRLYNVTNTQECGNDLTNGTAGTWATATISAATINAGCTGGTALNAGDIVEVQIKLLDNVGAPDYADVGKLIWNYTK